MKRCTILAAAALAGVVAAAGTITVVAPQEGAAKAVTVGNKASASFDAGKPAALKATANAGWAFAGWHGAYDAESQAFSEPLQLVNGTDWRTASASLTAGEADATVYARFVEAKDDGLVFDLAALFGASADEGVEPLSLTNALDVALEVDSQTLPTVTVTGLPAGLSFNKTTLRLTGTPTTPGVYTVKASAVNVWKYSYSQILTVKVENKSGAYLEGAELEALVGEEVEWDVEDLFFFTGTNYVEATAWTVTGLPAGLKLNKYPEEGDTYWMVEGTPTKAGVYTVTGKATFPGLGTDTATATFVVSDEDPSKYDVDFSGLDGLTVGDTLTADDEVVVGECDDDLKVGVTAVSGLPTGLSVVKTTEDGVTRYSVVGTCKAAGDFTVKVSVAYEDWETGKIATKAIQQTVRVADAASIYLSAAVAGIGETPNCKATGSGVYKPGATATFTATAGTGFVFAGWFDSADHPLSDGAGDYRAPKAAVTVTADTEPERYAAFVAKDDDLVAFEDLDGEEFTIDPTGEEPFEELFYVNSVSLPTVTFKNLPAGIAFAVAEEPGFYTLSYDPATATKTPTPGKYAVTATAVNVSRNSDTAEFTVIVANWKDERIKVEDDYGILTPNVAMEPISFSSAVDFAGGDTLAVSGVPTGLKYDAKTMTLSGIPTKPGNYTLTFTAKVAGSGTAVATAFITVKDFPTIRVSVDDEVAAAGNKVTGAGSYKTGTKANLKATAAKGWVFAGWSGVEGIAALNPSLAYVVGTDDLTEIEANFIEVRDDTLFVDDPGVVAVVKGVAVSTNLVETLIETRSLPTVSLSGLPTGLKFDAKTLLISGTVGATAKAGWYYATLAAKNAGGYTYARVVKFVVLDSEGDEIPEEPQPANDANIDFSALDGLATGDFCPADGIDVVAFYVDPADANVSAVTVSGLPAGLKAAVTVEDGVAEVVLSGTPTKAGRYTLKVAVTYADRSRATSEYAFIVEDGGSAWLDVDTFDASLGTVTGSGVYASGATVKLSAKPAAGYVFAGWYEDECLPFDVIAETDGVDYRTAAASFVFRKAMFASDAPALFADFAAKADDTVAIKADETWEIDPGEDSAFEFFSDSASLPKLTATGLPKGVTLDAAGGRLVYSRASQTQIVPGFYTVTLKAVNQSNASATVRISVFVANKTTDAIGGLSPDADAYPLYAGVALDPELILPEVDVDDGRKLTVAGLPTGLKLVQDRDTKAYSVTGIATRAGTNTVTFTATKGTVKEVATITVAVAALPAWANGTYDGAYFEFGDEGTNAVGSVTVTVSAAGKVSGKLLAGGKTYAFSAAAFDDYDAADGVFKALVSVPWSKTDNEEFLLTVGGDENGVGYVAMEPTGDGASFTEAVQNVWLRKDLSAPDFATGAKQPVLDLASGVSCKFGAKGVVTLGGKIDTVAVTGKAQVLEVSKAEGANARVVVYVANAKLKGGAYCEVVDLVLSDTDGDGKIDTVTEL